jgi:hypothetical protein
MRRSPCSVETGPIQRQAELPFANPLQELTAAGGAMADLTQV